MRTAPVGSLDTLLETLDLRRPAVAAHSRRVAACARQLGRFVGLDPRDLEILVTAALVHDVGALVGNWRHFSRGLRRRLLQTWLRGFCTR